LLEDVTVQPSAAESGPSIGDDLTLEQLERMHIEAVLRRCAGNRTRAAEVLGIERKSLYRKADRLGINLDVGKDA
jgi:DNA-binding NtrC family response regulator